MIIIKKIITAAEAAALVKDCATLAIQGIVCTSIPEELIFALRDRYLNTQTPKNITLFSESGMGDREDSGLNALAIDGLVGKLRCGHLGTAPKMSDKVFENKFPAFLIPQGVNAQMLRAVGGKKLGVITTTGLKTYADPRVEGCKVNQAARDCGEEVVELLSIGGREYLHYKPFNIDICFIRGTSADLKGNVTIEKEAIRFDQLELATATRSCGGAVIVQVERVVEHGTLKPHEVVIPGILIDYIVTAGPENHHQCTVEHSYHPEWCGEARIPVSAINKEPLTERKVIGRRIAYELKKENHVCLGIGTPETVASVAAEEGFFNDLTLSIECGVFGGIPASGLQICCAHNPDAIISQVNTFDLYDGGGIDVAVMGAAEIDKHGNVNVSKFNGRIVGPGGFVNITQGSKNIVFASAFMAGKTDCTIGGGKLAIVREGKNRKFVRQVEQITFSGEYAAETEKNVLYVTERAVFKLVKGGIMLIEIAPGIDLQKDILDQMEFVPLISENLSAMSSCIFTDKAMELDINLNARTLF